MDISAMEQSMQRKRQRDGRYGFFNMGAQAREARQMAAAELVALIPWPASRGGDVFDNIYTYNLPDPCIRLYETIREKVESSPQCKQQLGVKSLALPQRCPQTFRADAYYEVEFPQDWVCVFVLLTTLPVSVELRYKVGGGYEEERREKWYPDQVLYLSAVSIMLEKRASFLCAGLRSQHLS